MLNPTKAEVFLRINDPVTLTVTVTPGPLPLDLVLLEDLSGSFGDDIVQLRSLAEDMVTRVRNEIQADTNFGLAAFIDKSEAPFGGFRLCNSNAGNTENDCREYEYKNWLALTANDQDFKDTLDIMTASGGRDWPESTLEGTFHTAICSEKTGWRPNARHILLISSDADFHVAGEGEIIRALRPHREYCEQRDDADLFMPGHQDDYPSPSMVRDAMLKNNVVPIFAVTAGGNFGGVVPENIPLYEDLIAAWGFGFVTELASDSSNIIPAIFEAYTKTAETVRLLVNTDTYAWVDSITPTAGYDDARINIDYPFVVTLLASVGDENLATIIELNSFGFGVVNINVTTSYECACAGVPCPSTPGGGECNGLGTCECGQCQCSSSNFTGVDCGCDVNAPCDPPCINGDCNCGICECLPTWSGPLCDCSTLDCPGGGNCNGNGACVCGSCNCTEGFTGFDCGCSNSTICPQNCSGHGSCSSCGTCQCDAGWSGPACDCSTLPCPGSCSGHGECVCGECECDENWIDEIVFGSPVDCACNNVSCPIDPVTGDECGVGTCVCGECECPGTLGGEICNCTTDPCPSVDGVECGGNGTCVCGQCECAKDEDGNPKFVGAACECAADLTCPTPPGKLPCSGNGVCDCGVCNCATGWKHPTGGPNDCSCRNVACASTCVPPLGSCECGECNCLFSETNTTILDPLECKPESKAKCEPFGRCKIVPDNFDTCSTKEVCECVDISGLTSVIPLQKDSNDTCICVGNRCEFPLCSAVGAKNCTGSCGAECECLPGFVGPACSCNLNGPTNCDPSCKNGGTCVAAPPAQGKEECSYSCECVEPFTGVDCGECDPLVEGCPFECPALTCGDCLEDAKGQVNPRLQACVWCASANNGSCLKADECAALEGAGPLDACPVARSPSPSLIENDSVRYGGIAAIAVLLFIIAAIIIYKIYIWRKDRQLWKIFNEKQAFGLDQNPLYQDAFDTNENPLYDADADTGETFF